MQPDTGQGGAIWIGGQGEDVGTGSAVLTEVDMRRNTAGFGGALYFHSSGDLRMIDCTIRENQATQGAGFLVKGGSAFLLRGGSGQGTLVTSNVAKQMGGGVFVDGGGLTMDAFSLISKNGISAAPSTGGGLYVTGSSTLTDVRVADNTADMVLALPWTRLPAPLCKGAW